MKQKNCSEMDAPIFLEPKMNRKNASLATFIPFFYFGTVSSRFAAVFFCFKDKTDPEFGQSTNFCVWCSRCSCVEKNSTCVENVNLQLYFKNLSGKPYCNSSTNFNALFQNDFAGWECCRFGVVLLKILSAVCHYCNVLNQPISAFQKLYIFFVKLAALCFYTAPWSMCQHCSGQKH